MASTRGREKEGILIKEEGTNWTTTSKGSAFTFIICLNWGSWCPRARSSLLGPAFVRCFACRLSRGAFLPASSTTPRGRGHDQPIAQADGPYSNHLLAVEGQAWVHASLPSPRPPKRRLESSPCSLQAKQPAAPPLFVPVRTPYIHGDGNDEA